jgi:hypothetical protein
MFPACECERLVAWCTVALCTLRPAPRTMSAEGSTNDDQHSTLTRVLLIPATLWCVGVYSDASGSPAPQLVTSLLGAQQLLATCTFGCHGVLNCMLCQQCKGLLGAAVLLSHYCDKEYPRMRARGHGQHEHTKHEHRLHTEAIERQTQRSSHPLCHPQSQTHCTA